MSPLWTLEEALELHRRLLPVVLDAGFGLGMTGGVLTNGTSDHDIDLVLYPLQSLDFDVASLKDALVAFGMRPVMGREELHRRWRSRGSADQKWVEVWSLDGKRIDLFFLR